MKRLAWLGLVVLSGCASTRTTVGGYAPAESRRLAVLPFEAAVPADGAAVADVFVTALMSDGFSVIERRRLQAVFNELKLDMLGPISGEQTKQVGHMAGVDVMVFGSIGQNGAMVSVRMVDVETGRVILSSTFNNADRSPLADVPGRMLAEIKPQYRAISSIRGDVPNIGFETPR